MKECQRKLLLLKRTHWWRQIDLCLLASLQEVLGNTDIGQVKELPKAIDDVDLLRVSVDADTDGLP